MCIYIYVYIYITLGTKKMTIPLTDFNLCRTLLLAEVLVLCVRTWILHSSRNTP